MSGGVVRHAARQVNATTEIVVGLALGLAAGGIWRSWHMSYKNTVDEYYKNYDAQLKKQQGS